MSNKNKSESLFGFKSECNDRSDLESKESSKHFAIDEDSENKGSSVEGYSSNDLKKRHSLPNSSEIDQLSDDLMALDEQESVSRRLLIYKKNKVLFLLQSALLGISYSIIWPTVWHYTTEFKLKLSVQRIIYGLIYISYPMGSMFSAKIVEWGNMSTKHMMLILNMHQIVGNAMYALPFSPALLLIGRFLAGLGDAFYVVLMKEIKFRQGSPDEKMTIECLGAFIVGIVISPGINIITSFLHFRVHSWVLNSDTFPGVTNCVLFLLMQCAILAFLRENKEDYAYITPSTIKENNNAILHKTRFVEVTNLLRDMPYTSWFVNVYAFVYTYIIAGFELLIPIFMCDRLHMEQTEMMLLYAIIGTLYALFLMMTMTVTFHYQPETFICISIVMKLVGLVSIVYNSWIPEDNVTLDIITIASIVISLTVLWSTDDVLFIHFMQIFVPFRQRETTHAARKFVSKIAFGAAGITIPVFYHINCLIVISPLLIFIVCALFVVFVIIRLTVFKKEP